MSSFEIVFAVPMECESCVESVTKALNPIAGIESVDVQLDSNLVVTKGTTPPSDIVRAIQATGRDAIIRGTGKPNSAAVCILESFDPKDSAMPVKGLARIVSVNDKECVIDLTVNGLPKGTYYPSVRQLGNLSKGALSTGGVYCQLQPVEVTQPSDVSTTINSIGSAIHRGLASIGLCSGQAFLQAPMNISDIIGRSVILSSKADAVTEDSLCGVIARSAGAWENDKQVCSCTGKTVWQERTDALGKGITA